MNTFTNNGNRIFSKGSKASSEYFTNTAWVNILVPEDETGSYSIGDVIFEPGCRNHWHKHPAGQILLVTEGKGYYQERGQPAQLISKGDVIIIPSNTEHWHGASYNSSITHIAITNNSSTGNVEWLDQVTDKEYYGFQAVDSRLSPSLNLTELAIKNHEEILPGHKSTLQISDPELIEIFDNFAFDEVLSHKGIDLKTRLMMILGSTLANQAQTEYKIMLGAALNIGISPIEAKEILYQAVPYIGIAKAIDFLHITNEVLQDRGIVLPLEIQSTTSAENRYQKGFELQKQIFGEMIEEMQKATPDNQIHIQKYLSANCFGDYYTRNGLDIKIRELLTFSILITLGGAESQVKGHIKGNINIGNDKEVLISVITQLLPYIGYPRSLNALKCLNEVIAENTN